MRGDEKAFPEVTSDYRMGHPSAGLGKVYSVGGITKRELFAAMAMQAQLSNAEAWNAIIEQGDDVRAHDALLAGTSVMIADALIAELTKGERQ